MFITTLFDPTLTLNDDKSKDIILTTEPIEAIQDLREVYIGHKRLQIIKVIKHYPTLVEGVKECVAGYYAVARLSTSKDLHTESNVIADCWLTIKGKQTDPYLYHSIEFANGKVGKQFITKEESQLFIFPSGKISLRTTPDNVGAKSLTFALSHAKEGNAVYVDLEVNVTSD